MHIYITNLETSKDRKAFMQKQLQKIDIEYQFFDCVVGANLSEAEIASNCDVQAITEHNKSIHWFNKGIIGCCLTNQNIYLDILEKNLDYALLLEDDTIIPQNLPQILEHVQTIIRQGDVILLFVVAWSELALVDSKINSPSHFKYYLPKNANGLTGGSAFIVTRDAARKMLDANRPIRTTPDSWAYFLEKGCINRLLITYPFCIDTANLKSTMQLGSLNFISNFVHRYNIFPIVQILKWRRNKMKVRKQKVRIINS